MTEPEWAQHNLLAVVGTTSEIINALGADRPHMTDGQEILPGVHDHQPSAAAGGSTRRYPPK